MAMPVRGSAMFQNKTLKQSRVVEFIVLAFIMFLYIFLAGLDIRLPGINPDSASFGLYSYDIFKHKYIGLMLHPREGILDAYLVAPFFLFFDDPVVAIRYGCIFINGLALFIFYFFVRDFLRSRIFGIATILLIVAHPGFINASRSASWSNFNIFLPLSIAFLAFQKWHKNNKLVYFFTGIFFLGAALGTRIHSIWVINCLFICFFVLGFHRHFHSRRQFLEIMVLAIAVFMLGAWNLVLYNITGEIYLLKYYKFIFSLSKSLGTFRNILSDIANNPVVHNSSLAENVAGSFRNLLAVFNGNLLLSYSGCRYSLTLFGTYLFFISLGILSLQIFFKRENDKISLKKSKFLLILILLIFLQSLVTPQNYASYHFFILIPFAQLVITATLVGITGIFKSRLVIKVIFLIITLLVINQNIAVWHKTKSWYRMTEGKRYHSSAINKLVDWLENNRELKPVAVDWGFDASIMFLSKRQILPIRFYSQFYVFHINQYLQLKDGLSYFVEKWKNVFMDEKSIFLLYQSSIDSDSENYYLFSRLAQEFKMEPKAIKMFYTRDNELIITIFRLEKTGQ